MKSTGGSDEAKRRAGEAAADRVTDGDVVGLGTGSTAACAIRALGRAVDAGLDVSGIPTSYQSRRTAQEAGLPLTTLEEATPDVAIDGADEVATDTLALVKGGGAAHAREKYVDGSADRLLIVADDSKLADQLSHPVPVEVLPDAAPVVHERVDTLGGDADLRAAKRKDGPVVTDNGNLVLDCAFGSIAEPEALAADLASVPGVVEHGVFVDMADAVLVGRENSVETLD